MADLPPTKLQQVKDAIADGRPFEALRIATRFPALGEHRERITLGWAAHQRPEFYLELGRSPPELIADAFRAIAERYDLPQCHYCGTAVVLDPKRTNGIVPVFGYGCEFCNPETEASR